MQKSAGGQVNEVLRWKGVESIETACAGRFFFSARGSCSNEE